MLLQFCDKCGRPLSEGAIARGEAVTRGDELICSHCIPEKKAEVAAPEAVGALGDYRDAVWYCDSCGIPVDALDLVEGRASRFGKQLACVRCRPVNAGGDPAPQAPGTVKPPPAKTPLRTAGRKVAPATMPARKNGEEFVAAARQDARRPVLPVVLFVVVLSMFVISLYFAISSQQRLNEMIANRVNQEEPRPVNPPAADNRRDSALPDTPSPPPPPDDAPSVNPKTDTPRFETTPSRDRPPLPVPADIAAELVEIERDLAGPVIRKLQSSEIGEVWEGLIIAGSRRLVAARPYVRTLLRDPDDDTRLLACRVAGMLDDKDALMILSRMAESDPDDDVRLEARKARDRMTGQATRAARDMTDEEIEDFIRELQEELARRRRHRD